MEKLGVPCVVQQGGGIGEGSRGGQAVTFKFELALGASSPSPSLRPSLSPNLAHAAANSAVHHNSAHPCHSAVTDQAAGSSITAHYSAQEG